MPKVHVEQAVTLKRELVIECLQKLFDDQSSLGNPPVPVLRYLYDLLQGINSGDSIVLNPKGMYLALVRNLSVFSRSKIGRTFRKSEDEAIKFIPHILKALRSIEDPNASKFVDEIEKTRELLEGSIKTMKTSRVY